MPLTRRRALAAAAATALLTTLAACGGSGGDTAAAVAGGTTAVNVGALSNGAAKEVTINVPVVDVDPGPAAAPDPGRAAC